MQHFEGVFVIVKLRSDPPDGCHGFDLRGLDLSCHVCGGCGLQHLNQQPGRLVALENAIQMLFELSSLLEVRPAQFGTLKLAV